ncbi:MAG TPA: VWA domain-containing protein [Candidatus Acidoferrum sp.]
MIRSLLSAVSLLFLAGLCLSRSRGQEPPISVPVQGPTIKAESRIVVVDVVVTDKQGQSVPGLRKEDFHVSEDGGPQVVASFEEHQGAAPNEVKLPPMPPNVFTNFLTTRGADSVNVLLLDLLNTQPQNQAFVRQQVVKYLGEVPPRARLAVFALGSRLRIVRGFTTDFSGLSAVLEDKKLGVTPEVSRNLPTEGNQYSDAEILRQMRKSQAAPSAIDAVESFQRDEAAERANSRIEVTLQAFQQIARYLSRIPARKNLIWFSDNFPVSFFPDTRGKVPKNQEHVQKTSDMLTAAQVAIYPVSALGVLGDPTFDASKLAGSRRELEARLSANQIAMETIAEETGGRAFYSTNALSGAVTEAVGNGSHYYTLAYSPANDKNDGKFHAIQVSLADSNCKLSYRRGYFADQPGHEATPQEAADDPLMPLVGLGMPDFDQIVFKVQFLPKNPQPPANAPRAGSNTKLKAPIIRYDVNFAVALLDIAMSSEVNGTRRGHIEIMLIAFSPDGNILNILKKRSNLMMDPKVYEATQQVGMQIHEEIDVPPGEVYLRAGIYDLNSGACGTVGAALNSSSAQPSKK